MVREKKHADFQSRYRKSFNFNRLIKKEDFITDGKGNLVTSKVLNINKTVE